MSINTQMNYVVLKKQYNLSITKQGNANLNINFKGNIYDVMKTINKGKLLTEYPKTVSEIIIFRRNLKRAINEIYKKFPEIIIKKDEQALKIIIIQIENAVRYYKDLSDKPLFVDNCKNLLGDTSKHYIGNKLQRLLNKIGYYDTRNPEKFFKSNENIADNWTKLPRNFVTIRRQKE